jgi:hypothetical protein
MLSIEELVKLTALSEDEMKTKKPPLFPRETL